MKRILKILIPVMLIAFAGSVTARTPRQFESRWNELNHWLRDRVREEGIIGASLFFIHEGDLLKKECIGMADQQTNRRVDENTIYHWASITKTFTGIAIMQLRDRGLLDLDDPVIHYLPELRHVHNPFGRREDITIRQVLSHTSGFRSPTWPWGGNEPWHPFEPTSWDQIVAMLPYTQILFEPGSRFNYSNPAIIFLGRIIEMLTGDDYEVYVEKNILRPLGMCMAYFDNTPYHLLKHRSNNYTVANGEIQANGLDFDTGITVSNGGLNAPLSDMVKYLNFLMGSTETAEAEVLARPSLEEMWQAVMPTEADDTGLNGWTESLGLTFFVYKKEGDFFIGHTGSQQSFRAFFIVHPETRTAAIANFNTVGESSDGNPPKLDTSILLRQLRSKIIEEIIPSFR